MVKLDGGRPIAFAIITVVLGVLYAGLAVLGMLVIGPVVFFWPTAGLAVAAMFALGWRAASPGVALGAFLAACWQYGAAAPNLLLLVGVAVLLAFAVLMQSWIVVYLGRRFDIIAQIVGADEQPAEFSAQRLRLFVYTMLKLGAVGASAALIGAVIATLTLLVAGLIAAAAVTYGGVWWLGSVTGIVVLTAPLTMLARRIQARQLGQGAAVLVMDIGLIGSVLLFMVIWRMESQRIATEFAGRVEALRVQVVANLATPYHDLESLRAYAQASAAIESDEFLRFVQPHLAGQNATPGAQSFGWALVVPESERTAFEAEMRAAGFPDFVITELGAADTLHPAASRPDYTVIQFIASIGATRPALGLDLASEPLRRAALEQARTTGEIVATAPITLVNNKTPGLLLFAPAFQADAAGAPGTKFLGYMVGAYRIEDLLPAVLDVTTLPGLEVYLFDVTDPTVPERLYTNLATADALPSLVASTEELAALQTGLHVAAPLTMAGRHWLLVARPAPGYYSALRTWTPWVTLLVTLGLTVATVRVLAQRQHAADALRRQQLLLQTVIDSTPDWIFIKDQEHRYRLVNQGYAASLGIATEAAIGKNDLELGFASEVVIGDAATGIRGFWADDREVLDHGVSKLIPVEPAQLHGRPMFLQTIKTPIRTPDGAIWGVLGYVHDITEQERIVEALRQSEARFARVFDASPSALVVTRLADDRLVDVNAAFLDLFGYTREEVIGQTALGLGMYAIVDERTTLLERLHAGQPIRNHDLQIRTKTGDLRAVLISVVKIELGDGSGMISLMMDITERKAAEMALQRRTAELALLLDASRELSGTLDLRTVYTILHRTIRQWMPCDTVIISSYGPTEQLIRCVYYCDDVDEKDVSAFPPIPLELAGQGTQSLVIHSGHSLLLPDYEAQRATAATTYFVDDTGDIVTEIPDDAERSRSAILVPLNVDGDVAGVVQVFSNQTHTYTEDHLRFVEALVYRVTGILSNARLFQRLQQELAERSRAEAQVRLLNAQLEQRVAERTQDLTRALRTKDEFLANMSHELRTPLTSILALAEMLTTEMRGPLNTHQRKYVANIDSSGRHLLSLISDILDLSKVEAGKLNLQLTVVTVDEICRASLGMIKELAAQKGLRVGYHCSDASLVILADATRLKQMLVNLLSNAVKFTASGGRVALEAVTDPVRQVVEFSVQDTGIGIAATDIPRLFKPFTQLDASLARQHEGTGLGLALVQRLAGLHGGSVTVTSEGIEGKGSRFTIALPWRQPLDSEVAASSPAPASISMRSIPHANRAPSTPGVLSSPVILVVEDNSMNQGILSDSLQALGYRVLTASNGAAAIQQAQAGAPDLILMDVQMPVMDGLEATRRLRNLPDFATTPIIATTALARVEDKKLCLAAGIDDFLIKPFSLHELSACIERHLPRERPS